MSRLPIDLLTICGRCGARLNADLTPKPPQPDAEPILTILASVSICIPCSEKLAQSLTPVEKANAPSEQ